MVQLKDLICPAPLIRCGSQKYAVLSMTMHDGIILQSDRFKKSLASVDQSAYKVVRRNQLVVGFPIDEGVLYIQRVADEGIMSPAYDVWNVNQNRVDVEYLELCLHSPQAMMYYKTNLRGTTARRRSLPKDVLLALPIYLPDMEKQRHIARIIKKIKQLIQLHHQHLQALDMLIKAQFVEMFGDNDINPKGWKRSKIGECCTLKSGTSLPAEVENEGGPVPYIKVADMNYPGNERYITTSSRYVSIATAGNGLFEVGSILFPKRGGAIGTNKKRMTKLPICADLNIMGVSSKGALLPEYLLTYFDMIDLGALSDGSSVPQINNKNIAPLPILLPPIELQKQFVAFVSQIDKSKSVVQAALDEAQKLFDSLMQQYFG